MNQQTLTDDQLYDLLRENTYRIAAKIQGTLVVPAEDDRDAVNNAKIKIRMMLPKVEKETGQTFIRDEFKIYNSDIVHKGNLCEVEFVLRTEYLKHGQCDSEAVKEVNELLSQHIDRIEELLEATLIKNDDYAEGTPPFM